MKTALNLSPIYLVGPTGVGKTAVSLILADGLHAEIVVADSMQVYRGLDIGTAKPTLEEQKRIFHHLLDCVPLSEEFNAARFVDLARQAIHLIQNHAKIPLVVGGTGFYIRALIDGMLEGPGKDQDIRQRLEEEGQRLGWESLYKRLQAVDPVGALKVQYQNHRRLIRALEVYELTGKPFSHFHHQWKSPDPSVFLIGLDRDRDALRSLIDQRVDEMFHRGLVREVEGLMSKGIEKNAVIMQAIGYKEVIAFLRGKFSFKEAKERVKIHSRQFAKRQRTWFKRDLRIQWFVIQENESPLDVTQRILKWLETKGFSS